MGDVSLSEVGNCFKEHFLLSDPSVHRNRQECLEGCLGFPGEQLWANAESLVVAFPLSLGEQSIFHALHAVNHGHLLLPGCF